MNVFKHLGIQLQIIYLAINNSRNKRAKEISKARENGKSKKVDKLTKRDQRRTEKENKSLQVLNETLTELNQLERSNIIYDSKANQESTHRSAGGFVAFDTNRNSVTVNINGDYNKGGFAHKLKHAFQFEEGKLSLYTDSSGRSYGDDLYDIQDEVEAYARGSFFGGISSTIKNIGKEWHQK
jgi:hypothetical protein